MPAGAVALDPNNPWHVELVRILDILTAPEYKEILNGYFPYDEFRTEIFKLIDKNLKLFFNNKTYHFDTEGVKYITKGTNGYYRVWTRLSANNKREVWEEEPFEPWSGIPTLELFIEEDRLPEFLVDELLIKYTIRRRVSCGKPRRKHKYVI